MPRGDYNPADRQLVRLDPSMNFQVTYKTSSGRIGTIKIYAFRPQQAASYARIKLNAGGQVHAKIIGVKQVN